MAFFDNISSGMGDMQKRSFNMQFGGGCPICGGDESLSLSESAGEIVCGVCGAVFRRLRPSKKDLLAGDVSLELVSGRVYGGSVFPLRVWRMIRAIPREDVLIGFYREKFTYFYATEQGVIRESERCDYLHYGDMEDLCVSDVWAIGLVRLFFSSILVTAGLMSLMVSFPASLLGSFVSLLFLAAGAFILWRGRRQAYQFESPILSKKELRLWRLYKTDSPEAKAFVSLVRSKLKLLEACEA